MLLVAVTRRTGTCTSPKLIEPGPNGTGHRVILAYGDRRVSGRDRGSGADALEPRQGPLPRRRLPQSRRHRLLPPDRAGACSPISRAGHRPWCGPPTAPTASRFFEKRCPPHHPEWVDDRARPRPPAAARGLRHRRARGARVARQPRRARAAHPPVDARRSVAPDRGGARSRPRANRPTIIDCCRVALELRDILDQLDLQCVVKTSGGKGLHLSVPLNSVPTRPTRRRSGSRSRSGSCSSRATRSASSSTWPRTSGRARCSSTGVRTTATRRRCARTRCASASDRPSRRRSRGSRSRTRSTPATSRRCSRSRPPTSSTRIERVRRPLRRHAHRAPGTARALGSPACSSTGKSRSSPARAAASARRLPSCSRSAGARSRAPARATDAAAAADPGHHRRHRPPHHRRRRRRDRGADEPRARRRDRGAWSRPRSNTFGRVDILVNNAAITFPGDLDTPDEALRSRDAGRHARAPLIATAAVPCPAMKEQRRRRDRQRLGVAALELLPRPDGVRDGEGGDGAHDGVRRASARAVRHHRQHVPHRRAGRVGRLRLQLARTPTPPTGNRRRSRPTASCG